MNAVKGDVDNGLLFLRKQRLQGTKDRKHGGYFAELASALNKMD